MSEEEERKFTHQKIAPFTDEELRQVANVIFERLTWGCNVPDEEKPILREIVTEAVEDYNAPVRKEAACLLEEQSYKTLHSESSILDTPLAESEIACASHLAGDYVPHRHGNSENFRIEALYLGLKQVFSELETDQGVSCRMSFFDKGSLRRNSSIIGGFLSGDPRYTGEEPANSRVSILEEMARRCEGVTPPSEFDRKIISVVAEACKVPEARVEEAFWRQQTEGTIPERIAQGVSPEIVRECFEEQKDRWQQAGGSLELPAYNPSPSGSVEAAQPPAKESGRHQRRD